MPIRLLIASAHPIVRTALGRLLNGVRDFEVVGETDLSDLVKGAQGLSPKVFLIELTESGLSGLSAIAALMRAAPDVSVVILSSNENASYVRSMLAMGVRAYVLRSAGNSELYEAIRRAHRGRRYLDPRLSDSITDLLLGGAGMPVRRPHAKSLSRREAQVLNQIARGFTMKLIAKNLGVSEKTVQTYRARIFEKLQLRTRADLVHYAIAHGLLNSVESVS
jgi:two-component system, NarL family, response regulator NreC